MANLLNNIIANQPITPTKKEVFPEFSTESKGKVEPMADKGRLLPSRIFGSPIEYAKDLKQDIVNIGRAATGKANDHELGRINDVAMKLGSLALATYLFSKGHIAKNKAMEFIGVGTFFGSMALWPKLAIQLPIKLRTGVDVHQKYEDSQGRKKMMFQDPQYDLTDLYSREDLDRIGKKMGVSEDLPDRDSFIKQRAKKTATQANTLWMMTAGFATPVMSALLCNRLEKPVEKALSFLKLKQTEASIKNGIKFNALTESRQKADVKRLEKFLNAHANDTVDDELIKQLTTELTTSKRYKVDPEFIKALQSSLGKFKGNGEVDVDKFKLAIIDALSDEKNADSIADLVRNSDLTEVIKNLDADEITESITQDRKLARKISKAVEKALENPVTSTTAKKLSEISTEIKNIQAATIKYFDKKSILEKYIDARVAKKADSYIAEQWGAVGEKLLKTLKFSQAELKQIADGNLEIFYDKLQKVAKNETKFNTMFKDILKMIDKYNQNIGENFKNTVSKNAQGLSQEAARTFRKLGLTEVADTISASRKTLQGSVANTMTQFAINRPTGAEATFFRILHACDTINNKSYASLSGDIDNAFTRAGREIPPNIKEIKELCKNITTSASMSDHTEKFRDIIKNYDDYRIIMDVLYGNDTRVAQLRKQELEKLIGNKETVARILKPFEDYKSSYRAMIANCENKITPELERYKASGETIVTNAAKRNDVIGKTLEDTIKDLASTAFNSKKWMKMFGGTMAILTGVTLVAGLALGQKSKMEKQVEAESKK